MLDYRLSLSEIEHKHTQPRSKWRFLCINAYFSFFYLFYSRTAFRTRTEPEKLDCTIAPRIKTWTASSRYWRPSQVCSTRRTRRATPRCTWLSSRGTRPSSNTWSHRVPTLMPSTMKCIRPSIGLQVGPLLTYFFKCFVHKWRQYLRVKEEKGFVFYPNNQKVWHCRGRG